MQTGGDWNTLINAGSTLLAAVVGVVLGWLGNWFSRRRADRAAERERISRLASELLGAVMDAQLGVRGHDEAWSSTRAKAWVIGVASARLFAELWEDKPVRGVAAAVGTVWEWDQRGVRAAHQATVPAMAQVSTAWATLALAGNAELTQAARALVRSLFEFNDAYGGNRAVRRRVDKAVQDAMAAFADAARVATGIEPVRRRLQETTGDGPGPES